MTAPKTQVGRLAFRVEGDWWVAYYAMPKTMEGAIELSRISMRLVYDEARKQAFMDLMRSAIIDWLQTITNETPDWVVQRAPEHERAGRA